MYPYSAGKNQPVGKINQDLSCHGWEQDKSTRGGKQVGATRTAFTDLQHQL